MVIARKEGFCAICCGAIKPGMDLRPVEVPDCESQWAHFDCYDRDGIYTPLCKHFVKKGSCFFGEECLFRHHENEKGTAAVPASPSFLLSSPFVVEDKTSSGQPKELVFPRKLNDPSQRVIVRRGDGTKKRPHVKNSSKSMAFRKFLLDTYGAEYLASGSGILDVAGGKGSLAFEFVNLNRIPTTVVDPRPLNLSHCIRKFQMGHYHRNPRFNDMYNFVKVPAYLTGEEAQSPHHIRTFFELESLVTSHPPPSPVRFLTSPDKFLEELSRAKTMVWDDKGLHEGSCIISSCDTDCIHSSQHDASLPMTDHLVIEPSSEELFSSFGDDMFSCSLTPHILPDHFKASMKKKDARRLKREEKLRSQNNDFQESLSKKSGDIIEEELSFPSLTDFIQVREIVETCSILVGLHPDQATEHIINYALQNLKPFAVVPCCVYSKEFSHRKGIDGKPVTSYESFLDYLCAKHSGIQRAVLGEIEGKNIVLYFDPLGKID